MGLHGARAHSRKAREVMVDNERLLQTYCQVSHGRAWG